MNVLVIGGTRFMGPVVVAGLLDKGHAVTLFHRGETEHEVPRGAIHIHGDRNRLPDFRREFEKIGPDVVLDMMCLTQQQAADLVAVMTGITGRLVVASSCDVYKNYGLAWQREPGEPTRGFLTEDSPLRTNFYPYRKDTAGPEDPLYDYDKILVEQEIANTGLPATVLRLPMVYGPNDRQHRLYSYLKRMVDRRPAILVDPSRAEWRGVRGYRDNCAHAITLAVTASDALGRTYNVGEPSIQSEEAWIGAIATHVGWTGRVVRVPESELPEYLRTPIDWKHNLDVDSSLIRQELGFREIVSFEDGLNRTIDWELANPPDSPADKFDYAAEDAILRRLDSR